MNHGVSIRRASSCPGAHTTTGTRSSGSQRAMIDKVRTIPGVQSVAVSSNGPLMGGWQTGFWREGTPKPQPSQMLNADLEVVDGDYFSTLKVPLLRGRTFNERDTKDSPRVVIIDQAMAEQYFPGEDPIGKRIGVDAGNDEEGWVMSEIVGVVARMRFHAIDEMAPLPVIYCCLSQAQRTGLTLFVRSTTAFATLDRSIHDALNSIDPSLPLFDSHQWPIACRKRGALNVSLAFSFPFSPDSRSRSPPSVCMDCSLTLRSRVSGKSESVSRSARGLPRFAPSFSHTECDCFSSVRPLALSAPSPYRNSSNTSSST